MLADTEAMKRLHFFLRISLICSHLGSQNKVVDKIKKQTFHNFGAIARTLKLSILFRFLNFSFILALSNDRFAQFLKVQLKVVNKILRFNIKSCKIQTISSAFLAQKAFGRLSTGAVVYL